MFVIRYRTEVPLKRRKHEQTLGKFDTYGQALVEMVDRPNGGDLEVLERVGTYPNTEQVAR